MKGGGAPCCNDFALWNCLLEHLQMRISVITPCHNAAPWIATALRSVASQTFAPKEIIVVNDASTDDSLTQIERSGVPVRLLHVKARNAAIARNIGIEAANGEWIALLDADDKWYPNHLARAVELLAKTNDVAFMSNHDFIGLDDETLTMPDERQCKLAEPTSGIGVNDFFRIIDKGFHFGHSTVLYRRDRLREVGLFDPSQKRRHDFDLWLRMIAGQTCTYDTIKSAGYRNDTPGGLSTDETECDYFYLRALAKNSDRIQAPLFHRHISRQARRAMGIAFVDGRAEHYERIRALSWPHLSPMYRSFYRCAAIWPDFVRRLMRAKRRLADGKSKPTHIIRKAFLNGGVAAASGALAIALGVPRHRAYRRLLKYDPKQSCIPEFVEPVVETVPIHFDENEFLLPKLKSGVTSCFLQLDVHASITGGIFDPAVEIQAYKFRDIQFLERGVVGTRFLNISRLLSAVSWPEARVRLQGRHLTWDIRSARLHLYREKILPEDRVLVVAPHPDDAEIAAFGFYSDTQATVVTLTAGDASDQYGATGGASRNLSRTTIAKLRVLDSIMVPQYGGVEPEKAMNLCFPDGRLAEMHADPTRDFRGEGVSAIDFARLRRLNRSSLVTENVTCTWNSLVADLKRILMATKPTIIVAPHPVLDSHLDHVFTTIALGEAMQFMRRKPGRIFFYCGHNRRTELWPFGPAGTGVALLPIFAEDGICGAGLYSHPLSADRQQEKFLALEAMHDMRDLESLTGSAMRIVRKRLFGELRGLAHGMGRAPTSYFRRAVRPDEIFFVTSFADGMTLARRMVGEASN